MKVEDTGKGAFDLNEVYDNLLDLATSLLRPGGRLVFFYHTDDKKPDLD